MNCCLAKPFFHVLKPNIGDPRSTERAGITLEQYCCTKFEDLRQPVKKLLWEGPSLVNQEHGTAKRIQMLKVPMPLDGFQGSALGHGGQATGNERGRQKAEQSDPVLRVCDRELADRWEEEEVEEESRKD